MRARGNHRVLTSIGLPWSSPMPCASSSSWVDGLISRLLAGPAALAVIVVMVGAIAKAHWPHGFFLNWELSPGKGHGFGRTSPPSRWP